MKQFLPTDLEIKTSDKKDNMIHQTQRNEIKHTVLDSLVDTIKEVYGIEVINTLEGPYLLIPNDKYSQICVNLDVKIKPLDTDTFALEDDYKDALDEKAAKKAEKEAKAAERAAKQAAKAAAKEND